MSIHTISRAELLIKSGEKMMDAFLSGLFKGINLTLEYSPENKNGFRIKSLALGNVNTFVSLSNMRIENEVDKYISQYHVKFDDTDSRKNLEGYVRESSKQIYIRVVDVERYFNASMDKIVKEYKPKLDLLKEKLYTKLADTNGRGVDYVGYVNSQIATVLAKAVMEDCKISLRKPLMSSFSTVVHELNHVYDKLNNPEIFDTYISASRGGHSAYASQLAEVFSVVYQTYYDSIYKISDNDIINCVVNKEYFLDLYCMNGETLKSFYTSAGDAGKKNYATVISKLYIDFYKVNYELIQSIEFIERFKINMSGDISNLETIFDKNMLSYIKLLDTKEKKTILVASIIKQIVSNYTNINKTKLKNDVLSFVKDAAKIDISKRYNFESDNIIDTLKKKKPTKAETKHLIDSLEDVSKDEIKKTKHIMDILVDKYYTGRRRDLSASGKLFDKLTNKKDQD